MYLPITELLEGQKEILSKLTEFEKKLQKQPIKKYSPQELADATGVSVQTIWSALKKGLIKGTRFGKRYLISSEEFERACKDIKTIKYQRTT